MEDGSYVTLRYDDESRVDLERSYDPVDTLLSEVAYTYNDDGNRTSMTRDSTLDVYDYAAGSTLTRITNSSGDVATFTYDAGGRVTGMNRDVLSLGLEWDSSDHIVTVTDESAGLSTHYTFDGEGRRTARTSAGDETLHYLIAPSANQSLEAPQLVMDASSNVVTAYVYSGESPLLRYDAALTPTYYLEDGMGSVIALMDGAGAATARFDYDSFGVVRGGEGGVDEGPGGDFRFHGMWRDRESGLYYVRARMYDAISGRFLSRDPADGEVAMPSTLQPYVFAQNSPHYNRDPDGRETLVGQMFGLSV